MVAAIEIVELTQSLIKCPSVTPADAGALDVLQGALETLGFVCYRLPFREDNTGTVDNLYARLGSGGPNFCYAGHTDVVPPGDIADWSYAPFEASVEDGFIYGRGAVDMKGAIAAFVVATKKFLDCLSDDNRTLSGSISLLITGDEEGAAINGTKKVLGWLHEHGETLDHCLVGEPTNRAELGDMVKIGRRGSLNAEITVKGVQGHVAYPEAATNPIRGLTTILSALQSHSFDDGTEEFQTSNLEVTSVDVGNEATNVIPACASARVNIRFGDRQDGSSLSHWIRNLCDAYAKDYNLDVRISGEAFLTPRGAFTEIVSNAVAEVSGTMPTLSTSGGTSDARFIKDICPVVEFGLVGRTMHKVDECVAISDLEMLSDVYLSVLERYFLKTSK